MTAAILFMVYSALVGITSSVILLVYTAASIFSAFVARVSIFSTRGSTLNTRSSVRPEILSCATALDVATEASANMSE